ncbi:hypothetical protein [Mesorhizobium sp. A556]
MNPKPILSTAGNPFPPGLKPVFVRLDPIPGIPPERMLPRPLDPNPPKSDFSHLVTTETYLYAQPDAGTPRFKLRFQPRGRGVSEAQHAAYRRSLERHFRARGVYLKLMQLLCGALGNFQRCGQHQCRREKACRARRDEDAFNIDLAVFPPCVPLDLDIIASYREAVRAEVDRLCAWHAKQDSGPGDFVA